MKPRILLLALALLLLALAYLWTRTIHGWGEPGTPEDRLNVPVVWKQGVK